MIGTPPLPIDDVLPRLLTTLRTSRNAVLVAAPAAGKTTRVPPALLASGLTEGRGILMLEPRRLAASRAARYMAGTLGEEVGGTVGYRTRGESRVSAATRIEVVTEGILTRMIQHDPSLTGTGILIFDEYHERSIHADLGLALALEVQAGLRNDLRILVMSATLDGAAVARLLDDAPVLRSEGTAFPVETRYRTFPVEGPVEPAVAETVRRSLERDDGDILVFLPGRREIERTRNLLEDGRLPGEVSVHLLFSDAARETQDAALRPAPAGHRKVILSTSIAETSLTIDGVRIVIDAGLARVPVFDPRRGMSGLVTVPVARATADQRRGRAARQGPGICYRLWQEHQTRNLPPFPTPQILSADAAPLALELARWGTPDAAGLRFLDPPPPSHLSQARTLLRALGALDKGGALTSHGRRMADLPAHPRLAHMLLKAADGGSAEAAAEIAALLEERELLARPSPSDIDVRTRLDAMAWGTGADPAVRLRIRTEAQRLRSLVRSGQDGPARRSPGALLSLAFPERVARRRPGSAGRFLTTGGTGVQVRETSPLAREEFLVFAELATAGVEARAVLACPITREEILEAFGEELVTDDRVSWDEHAEAVVARRVTRLGAMPLAEQEMPASGPEARAAMLNAIGSLGLSALPWTDAAEAFRARTEWIRRGGFGDPDWPDLSNSRLLATLDEWLGPFMEGTTRRTQLERLNLTNVLRSRFSQEQLRTLDRLAPETIVVPTGSRIRLDYAANPGPVLAVRLQEMFGATATPTVGGGGHPVVIHLLSPAGRPLAVTQDLTSFWRNAYPQVRKEMRGRYPRHHWPENPLEAAPTRNVKRRAR